MDPPSKTVCDSQSGFNFPALEGESINTYFPEPITGMNAVYPSVPMGTRRCHGTTIQLSSQNVVQNLNPATQFVPAQPGNNTYPRPTASATCSDSHTRNVSTQKQLLLFSALKRLLNPTTRSLPGYPSHDIQSPLPQYQGCAPAICEPCRMPSFPPYPSAAGPSVSAVRPRLHVDPRGIPSDIAAIIAAAAASMTTPSVSSAGAAAAAAAAAAFASMPPPLPRAPLVACGRCGQRGCGCGCGSARRRPRAVEPLSLGPGDPDRCRPTARRRVGGGGAPAEPTFAAAPLRARSADRTVPGGLWQPP
jgi:hypothetical protein